MKICPGRIIINIVLLDTTRNYNTAGVHNSGSISLKLSLNEF